jgi:hypothetical protein
MHERTWNSELLRFREIGLLGQLQWLSQLIFLLTMFARETYEPGADGVVAPERLRRFNELVHRVAAFQKKIANSWSEGLPDEALFRMLADRLEEFRIAPDSVLSLLP